MTILRKLAAALLAAVLAAALAVPSMAAFNQETLNGIVLIRTGAPDENGVMNYWRGTGFFVGTPGEDPEYIVTNCHVVDDFILAGKALGGGELHVLFDQDEEEEAYLVDYDVEKDIAVLRLEEPTDKRSALQMREVEDTMLGDEVYAVGYPLAADMTVQAVNSFSPDDATVTAGSIGRLLTESGTGRRLIHHALCGHCRRGGGRSRHRDCGAGAEEEARPRCCSGKAVRLPGASLHVSPAWRACGAAAPSAAGADRPGQRHLPPGVSGRHTGRQLPPLPGLL